MYIVVYVPVAWWSTGTLAVYTHYLSVCPAWRGGCAPCVVWTRFAGSCDPSMVYVECRSQNPVEQYTMYIVELLVHRTHDDMVTIPWSTHYTSYEYLVRVPSTMYYVQGTRYDVLGSSTRASQLVFGMQITHVCVHSTMYKWYKVYHYIYTLYTLDIL